MKISIVTVSYNAVQTIEQTINSVLNQKYSNLEYIIIDGGSTDGTVDIIKKYKKDIHYWVSESDQGLYHAMNKGTKAAQGEYIQFLNADDAFISSDSLLYITKYLNCNADIISSPIVKVDENTSLQIKQKNVFDFQNGQIPHQGMIIKTSIQRKYLFNEEYHIKADYDFLLRSVKDGALILFLDKPLVFFGSGGISASCRYDDLRFREHICAMIENKIPEDLIQEYKKIITKSKLREFIKKNFFRMGMLEYFRRKKLLKSGWTLHHCNNKYCRWCKKIQETSPKFFG